MPLVHVKEDESFVYKSKIVLIGWGNVMISGTGNPALKSLEGKTMVDAARDWEAKNP